MLSINQTRASAMRETPKEASSRSGLRLAVETTLHFFHSTTCRGCLLRTANEFGGLEFGRLTYPGRDRQQAATASAGFPAREKSSSPKLIFDWWPHPGLAWTRQRKSRLSNNTSRFETVTSTDDGTVREAQTAIKPVLFRSRRNFCRRCISGNERRPLTRL